MRSSLVFKIIIIFQFKNFNPKFKKKKIYTQTTDLNTPGKKANKKPNQTRKSALSGTQSRTPSSPTYNLQGLFLRFFILQPVSLVKLKVHFIYYLKVLYSVKPELYVKYCLEVFKGLVLFHWFICDFCGFVISHGRRHGHTFSSFTRRGPSCLLCLPAVRATP